MAVNRPSYTAAEETGFTTEVGGKCPLCGKPLFKKKGKKQFKRYEIAHIYPLNPKPEEVAELENEEKLSSDPNAFENLVALCIECHDQFDNPRTAAEYRNLVEIKRGLLRRIEQQRIQYLYKINDDIRHVIDGLNSISELPASGELNYDPKRIDDKLDSSMPFPTRIKIKHNVSDYYQYVRSLFEEVERASPAASELISSQVKTFYLEQKVLDLSQHEIFLNVVDWIAGKTKPATIESAEIVASYFVQNCEVFE